MDKLSDDLSFCVDEHEDNPYFSIPLIQDNQSPHDKTTCIDDKLTINPNANITVMPDYYQPDKVGFEASRESKKGYNFYGKVETSRKKLTNNKRIWDKSDNCIYCEKKITNFTRHIMKRHSTEIDVIRYIALPKGSKERKVFSDNLRKRGNFLANLGNEPCIKPVRRPNDLTDVPSASQYLPCKHCYGLFKRGYLFSRLGI